MDDVHESKLPVQRFHRLLLVQNPSLVGKCIKCVLSVVRTHTTVANSAKGQRFHCKTNKRYGFNRNLLRFILVLSS